MHQRFLSGLIISIIIIFSRGACAQSDSPPAYFDAPDSICANTPFTVSNVSSGTTFFWNFCSANTNYWPVGNNFGNVDNAFSKPRFITLVEDQGNFYCFITNSGNQSLVRLNFGASLLKPPGSATPVFPSVVLPKSINGIQINKDYISGTWVGFIAQKNSLSRIVFNNGLTSIPDLSSIPCPGLGAGSGLAIVRENNNWIGFLADSLHSKLFRLKFDSSLMKVPTFTNMGDFDYQLSAPMGIKAVNNNGQKYLFICNSRVDVSSVSVLIFGSSFMNNPTWIGGGFTPEFHRPVDISVLGDCNSINGNVTNLADSSVALIHILYNQMISDGSIGPPDNGHPNLPYGISELIRIGDTIFSFYVNSGNSTISSLYFLPFTTATPVSSTIRQPGPIVYNGPGIYNILLRVDESLPGESSFCRPVFVFDDPVIDLGRHKNICQGKSLVLDPVNTFQTFLWSTGETTKQITVSDSGTYWLRAVTVYGCVSTDTVRVSIISSVSTTVDTTICYGDKYFAGGAWQTAAGQYTDTLTSTEGCDSVMHTDLTVRPKINVNLGADTSLCRGDTKTLDATTSVASGYLWQDGSISPKFTVTGPGTYWVQVTVNGCTGGDTINIEDCPYVLFFPNAFTPDNDGLNDVFRPVSMNITVFHMEIYDRWGTLLFATDDLKEGWNGIYKSRTCKPETYVYEVTFETLSKPGQKKKAKGTFSIVN
jgi:gliding motility-associated-like protein